MKTKMRATILAKMIVLLACAQFMACSKSSDSSGRGSSAPAAAAPTPALPEGQTPQSEQFEPGIVDQMPPEEDELGPAEGELWPEDSQSPGMGDLDPQGDGWNSEFRPSNPNSPDRLPPGPIPPGTTGGQGGMIIPPGGSQRPPTHVIAGSNTTGLSYDSHHNYVGSGSDQLLAELKARYASLPADQFEKSRERAANISRIRIGFNSVTNKVYAAVTLKRGPKKVLEYSGTVNLGMQAQQSHGPTLSLNCTDNNCMAMVGRLDYADGTRTSFIYRNHDKKLIFDFLTSGSVTEQTYRNWIRLIDSQLELDPNCAKIVYREYASYEVAYGRSEAVLVIKTNFDEIVEVSVPIVASKSSDAVQISVRGELRGLSGTPYLSYNILKTEIISNSGQGNIVMKITTGRSAVDQGEFLISVVEK